jgi:hypothetical protein
MFKERRQVHAGNLERVPSEGAQDADDGVEGSLTQRIARHPPDAPGSAVDDGSSSVDFLFQNMPRLMSPRDTGDPAHHAWPRTTPSVQVAL